jgi:hypothetical protein
MLSEVQRNTTDGSSEHIAASKVDGEVYLKANPFPRWKHNPNLPYRYTGQNKFLIMRQLVDNLK